jgi:hypothetical protein
MTTNRLITAAWVIAWVIGFILIALSWNRVVPWWVGSVGAGITAVAVIVSWRRKKPKG